MHLASSVFYSILYADDTTLLKSLSLFNSSPRQNSNIENVSNYINNELNKVYNWLVANKLSLNIAKTKFMIFHFPQRKLNFDLHIKIDNVPIQRTEEFDFLGLRIHENLNWNPHMNKISNKLSKVMGFFKTE